MAMNENTTLSTDPLIADLERLANVKVFNAETFKQARKAMIQATLQIQGIEQFSASCVVKGGEQVREIARLRAALGHYTNCRHGCIECFCTKEARAAL